MTKKSQIIVTGAAGFIGSCMVGWLLENGYTNIVVVDAFEAAGKLPNLAGKSISEKVERSVFFEWLQKLPAPPAYILHLGARTDTTEFDYSIHQHWNVEYTQQIWNYCTIQQIPLIYASSAATYGDGSLGYKDDHALPFQLEPLNPYGVSKNEVDKWILHEEDHPPFWAGLKFFNVYGPNEYHKGRMASVIWHAYNQIRETGKVRLFRSHRPDFKDGWQLRDFIYVKDVVEVIGWFMQQSNQRLQRGESLDTNESVGFKSGLYNLGTGAARSFYDLAVATFHALGLAPNIEFIDMPEDIRDKYQYFTEADMQKLRQAGFMKSFTNLEDGVKDYVQHYLVKEKYL
ncbi:MAG: ADP-glyceromanno-heptose 6-epimerase [Bacteroidetes bacterium]|nr:ADP-glyceromanno-heptose 6-epimerase [Bacteroidota bacterium]